MGGRGWASPETNDADLEDRAALCFDCGEDMQPAHFGEK